MTAARVAVPLAGAMESHVFLPARGEQPVSTRHVLPLPVAAILRRERLARGWTLRRTEREAGVSNGYVSMLERGLRAPSFAVADCLVAAFRLTYHDAEALRSHARHAGRSRPYGGFRYVHD